MNSFFSHQYYHPKFRDKLHWCKDSQGWPQNSLVKEVLKAKSQACTMFLKEVTMQRNTHNDADPKQTVRLSLPEENNWIFLTSLRFGILMAWHYCRHRNNKSTKVPWSSEKTNLMWLFSKWLCSPCKGCTGAARGTKADDISGWETENINEQSTKMEVWATPCSNQPGAPWWCQLGLIVPWRAPKLPTSVSAVSQPLLIITL